MHPTSYFENLERERPVRRQRHRWEDNVKMGLIE
jgi:hypothetical protein